MSSNNYLLASIPKVSETTNKPTVAGRDDRILSLEQRLEDINNQLIKQNRDNQDARDNVDEENLSESLLRIIKDLQERVAALEAIINTTP